MSRWVSRAAVLAAALLSSSPVFAQSDPAELARGLRDNGHADLALEFLEDLSKKAPPPEVLAVLPLEKARVRLALAGEENEDGKRDLLVAQARAELNQFLTANANHPRRAEAAISLARLLSIQAKGMVSRAARIDDEKLRTTELVRARPVFQDAADKFKAAAVAYEKLADDPALSAAQKRATVTDVYQAEIDRARNLFSMASTFDVDASAAERQQRGKMIDDARVLFDALSKKDKDQPLAWVAKAWVGQCEFEKDNPVAAEEAFTAIERAANQNRAAQAGVRQVRFFRMVAEYGQALKSPSVASLQKAQASIERWLGDRANRSPRPSPEQYSAMYYLAITKYQQAMAQVKAPKAGSAELPNVPDAVKAQLRAAARDFRKLTLTENDYTSRAAERETQATRLIVGTADRDPARITNFDEALMTAKVRLYNLVQEKTAEERAKKAGRVVALYERVRELPPADEDDARAALDAQVTLIYVYLLADRPYHAAVLGEHLARTARSSGPAARSGLYSVQAYLATAAKAQANDEETRKADQARAAAVAAYLDQRYPTDTSTDFARLTMGQTFYRNGRPGAAFATLAKVTPASPRLMSARLFQGAAAFDLLRMQADTANEKAPTPAQKGQVYNKVVADLTAVPDLPASAPPEEANLAVLVELQIAELHILDGVNGYPKAERSADRALAEANKFTNLDPEEKQELVLKCQFAKLRAIYAQAVPLFQTGKYPQAMAKIAPVLADLAKDGPANKPGLPEQVGAVAKQYDDYRRDKIIVLALQTRIGEGAVDKAGELFDLLKKLGGSADAIAQALGQLAQSVRPQVEKLRAENKAGDADKLIAAVGQLLDKVAKEPNISQPALFNLGRAMKDIGSHDRAVEMLAKVKDPGAPLLAKPIAQLTDTERLPVLLYRGAQLELARSHRMAKKFPEAEKVLSAAMGTKDAKGWAFTAPDYRREVAYLKEEVAENTADPKAALPVWREAIGKWGEMAAEYLSVMRRPIPKDDKARAEMERLKAQVKPLYHDIFFESTRCTCRANSHLLKGNAAQLAEKFAASAKSMIALENANPDMSNDVRAKFTDLLEKYPELKQKYTEQQGKMFLQPAANAAGAQ